MASTDPPISGRTRPTPPLPSPIVHLSFSSDASCFIVAGTSSVHWFSCDTFGLRGLYEEKDARRTIVAAAGDMLSLKESACTTVSRVDTNYSVRRWKPGYMNYHWRYFEEEKTCADAEAGIRTVHVHGKKTVVVLADRIEVLGPRTKDAKNDVLSLLHSVVTFDNPLGLCAVSSGGAPFAFACPGARAGDVHVERWEREGEARVPAVAIGAHSSRLASIAMSCDGRLVATASVRGTLVRIFSAIDGALLQELRRGTDGADIHCIAFSSDSKWLGVTSDKATVHVFSINVDLPSLTPKNSNGPEGLQAEAAAVAAPSPAIAKTNKRSSLSFAGGLLPGYFSSEWSSTQIRVPEGTKYLVAFGSQPNTIIIIGMDGSFYRCPFDPEKGGVVDVRNRGTTTGNVEQDVECLNFMNLSKKTSSSQSLI